VIDAKEAHCAPGRVDLTAMIVTMKIEHDILEFHGKKRIVPM